MPKRLTQDEFIARAKAIHGDKYCYDEVVYVNRDTKVKLLCHKHGAFYISPKSLLNGHGCIICGNEMNSKIKKGRFVKALRCVLFGECYNDVPESIIYVREAYTHWRNMLVRCYNKNYQQWKPSYSECTVCDEWKYFSNFLTWFRDPANGFISGHCLDKDILLKGNKTYNPENCCFVPPFINTLLINRKRERGELPLGVKPRGHKFFSQISIRGKMKYLGLYNSIEEAFSAYKNAKELYLKECATEYYNKGLITEKVYKALLNYKIEITD